MSRVLGILIVFLVAGLAVDRCVPVSRILGIEKRDAPADCQIKGNINLEGERIYHVPGGKWYTETEIDELEGEHWFCSEEEAREAGWRKSYK